MNQRLWTPQWVTIRPDWLFCYACKHGETTETLELYASCRFFSKVWTVKLGGFSEFRRFGYLENAQKWVDERLVLDRNGVDIQELEAICLELKSSDWHVRRIDQTVGWVVTRNVFRFTLHFRLKTNEWILLPTTPSPLRDRLMLKIEKALALVRS